MTQELAKKSETHLTAVETAAPAGETILRQDVIVPRVLLMQGLSDLVNARKAQSGDIVRAPGGHKLGDDTHPLKFIPLTFVNQWILTEKVGPKKWEFRGIEPRTSANETLDWEFERHGAEWKRVKALDLFALLVSDIEAEEAELKAAADKGEMPDLNKALLPVLIRFQSTSFQAGRHVVQHFAKAQKYAKYGVKPYAYSLELSCHSETNDQGTFFVFDVSAEGQKISKDFEAKAAEWYATLSTSKVSVHEEEIVEAEPVMAAAPAGKAKF